MAPAQNLFVAIPVLDELDALPGLLSCLGGQSLPPQAIWICVNQPESWWRDPGLRGVCLRNQKTLSLLNKYKELALRVVDRSSPGKGWPSNAGGVGRARRLMMDAIAENAHPDDIIVSLDADTRVGPKYLQVVREGFARRPRPAALVAPYWHPLSGHVRRDRALLRYEIYLRCYVLNLWRIGSPYAFTALGSAISFPVAMYRAVGGMPPRTAGEDFHFLCKLSKLAPLLNWCPEQVQPAGRISRRVPFGTGPAVLRGMRGDWKRYPIFDPALFDHVKKTTASFARLFAKPQPTPLDDFFRQCFNTVDPFAPLRKNYNDVKSFIRACHQRLDGLRIYQYLRWATGLNHRSGRKRGNHDERNLAALLENHFLRGHWVEALDSTTRARLTALSRPNYRFDDVPFEVLVALRAFLARTELCFRRQQAQCWPHPVKRR
jgi:hypothetical protein